MAAVLFLFFVVTSVDLNTVQVTYTVQPNSFVFEDCHKSYFNSIQDADPCSTVPRETHFNSIFKVVPLMLWQESLRTTWTLSTQ